MSGGIQRTDGTRPSKGAGEVKEAAGTFAGAKVAVGSPKDDPKNLGRFKRQDLTRWQFIKKKINILFRKIKQFLFGKTLPKDTPRHPDIAVADFDFLNALDKILTAGMKAPDVLEKETLPSGEELLVSKAFSKDFPRAMTITIKGSKGILTREDIPKKDGVKELSFPEQAQLFQKEVLKRKIMTEKQIELLTPFAHQGLWAGVMKVGLEPDSKLPRIPIKGGKMHFDVIAKDDGSLDIIAVLRASELSQMMFNIGEVTFLDPESSYYNYQLGFKIDPSGKVSSNPIHNRADYNFKVIES